MKPLFLTITFCLNLIADEKLLSALEGQRATVLLDLPASAAGIDIYVANDKPVNFRENSDRIRSVGVAFRFGTSVQITRVKVKGEAVEVHLDGGGYDWKFVTGTANLQRARQEAPSAGSRVNVRFPAKSIMAATITVDELRKYLIPVLTFGQRLDSATSDGQLQSGGAEVLPLIRIKKGMIKSEVVALLGNPLEVSFGGTEGLAIEILKFETLEHRVEVRLVSNVVIAFSLSSR